ncbi:MAG: aerobic respiration control sensor protein ArcB [Methanocella sp. PtaU1.Bin125]|nr:MAG: aerobic respiration control sensor protein ArcB [Methanocella sp. PtaU1.Bin125]
MVKKVRPDRNAGTNELDIWIEKVRFLSDSMESTSQPFAAGYPDGRLALCNKAYCDLTGYTKDELLKGVSWSADLTPEEWRDGEARALEVIRKTLKPHRYEKEYNRKDGTRVPIELLVHPAFDSDGRILFYYSFITDISERKKAEEALRDIEARRKVTEAVDRERRRLLDILENLPAMICLLTRDHHVAFANRSFRERFGESRGRRCYEYCFGLTAPCEFCEAFEVFKTGKPHRWEVTGPGGSMIEAYDFPFIDVDGTPMILEMDIDITERKQAEEALSKAKQQAELYLDLMGHDISNMHQIALGYLELAKAMQEDESKRELLDRPIEVLQRSARLIANVRKMQRLNNGVFKFEPVDVASVLQDVQREFGSVPRKNVMLNLNGPVNCTVRGNELLYDVFANLVSNAIKHTRENTVISIQMDTMKDNGRSLCRVAVEDNGPGVADDFKGKIFNRILRGTKDAKGSGIGLYLVKSLVESYSGRIWVEDRVPGDHTKGSKFIVELPVVQAL